MSLNSPTNNEVLFNGGFVRRYTAATGKWDIIFSATTAEIATLTGLPTGFPFYNSTTGTMQYWNGSARTAMAGASAGGGAPIDFKFYTASGTWTKPSSGTMALVECYGGGGGGSTSNRAGGGGGGYCYNWIALSSLGASVSVTVGAGGTAGATGGTGGSSSFSTIIANGGLGSSGTIGGEGGSGSGGFVTKGQNGVFADFAFAGGNAGGPSGGFGGGWNATNFPSAPGGGGGFGTNGAAGSVAITVY